MLLSDKFRFVSDDDGHHYMIPADRVNEWDTWTEGFYTGVNDGDFPDWAERIDSPSQWTFMFPVED